MKKAARPQSRRHIMVYDEDWELFMRLFGNLSARPGTGPGRLIQEIIHKHAKAIRQVELDVQDEGERTRRFAAVIQDVAKAAGAPAVGAQPAGAQP